MDWIPARGSLLTDVIIGDYCIAIMSCFLATVLGYWLEAASGMGEKEGSHMAIFSSFSLWLPGPPLPFLSFY